MKITLLGFGSRGDVQPLLALAHGLMQAGYDVAIAAGKNFREMVEKEGIAFEGFRTDMQALMNSESGKEWIENSSDNPLKEAQNMRRMVQEVGSEIGEDVQRIIENTDVVVSGLPSFHLSYGISKKLNKKHFTILFAPMNPTVDANATMVPSVPRKNSVFNRLAGYIGLYFTHWIFKDASNEYLQKIGAAPISYGDYARAYNQEVPVIYGLSQKVMPRPNDWKTSTFVTGYWFYDAPQDWQAPESLCKFLEAGEKPVYIGFGSMANKNPEATAKLMIEALEKTGKRGIIHTGWAGLRAENLPESIYLLDYAPHDWLFPQMAAVVHHGGAGTTGAALRAGVPSTVVAHMADQPFWGRRVHELGVGAPFIRRHELSAESLADAIQYMTNKPEIADNAKKLGAAIQQEDGIGEAVRIFNRLST